MKNLVLHIEYLLTQCDCVVVPGWGALVVQHEKAQVCADRSIAPPRRWISFNPLLTHNDGTLAHSVMRAEGCSFDEAMQVINNHVNEWHDIIASNKSIEWPNIGAFHGQEDLTLQFVEADNSVVNASLSLLSTLSMPLLVDILSKEEPEEEIEVVQHEQPALRWYQSAWSAVASVAAVIVFMLFISTPVDNFQPTNDYANMVATEVLGVYTPSIATSPVVQPEVAVQEEETTQDCEPVSDAQQDDVVTDAGNCVAMQNKVIEPKNELVEVEQETPRYILVIGSLPTRALAEKQIAEFESMGVTDVISIYESNGKYRLYIEGYDNMDHAKARLAYYNEQPNRHFAGIWICSTK